jgi:isopentenyl-diphosphate delta-isomerase
MSKVTPTSERKSDHIQINLEEDVESGLSSGLDRFSFQHNAVPELNLQEVDLSLDFLGHALKAPLIISSMTGGTAQAQDINQKLAEAAQEFGIAMGLGSQRAAIEDPSLEYTYQVRRHAPDILLFANLGAVQLNYGYGIEQAQRVVDSVRADGLVLHFNALQEALQPEGDTNFEGLLRKVEGICRALPVPVIAKEVGWGISGSAASRLVEAGVSAIDVAGAGGTSWSQVEMHRAESPMRAKLASSFINWGLPTASAIQQVREALPDIPLIGSGALRSGIDVAKCIALGADICGMAGPFLRAAANSFDALHDSIDLILAQMQITMFATGCKDLASLRRIPLDVNQ